MCFSQVPCHRLLGGGGGDSCLGVPSLSLPDLVRFFLAMVYASDMAVFPFLHIAGVVLAGLDASRGQPKHQINGEPWGTTEHEEGWRVTCGITTGRIVCMHHLV